MAKSMPGGAAVNEDLSDGVRSSGSVIGASIERRSGDAWILQSKARQQRVLQLRAVTENGFVNYVSNNNLGGHVDGHLWARYGTGTRPPSLRASSFSYQ